MEVEVDQLVQLAKRGDRQAMSMLCEQLYDRLFRFFVRQSGSVQDAEDLTQSALLKMMEQLDKYHRLPGVRFEAWLLSMAYRLFIDWVRKKKPIGLGEYDRQDFSTNVEEEVAKRESAQELRQALLELDEELRALLTLRYEFDLSYAEIASALKITVVRVRWRLHEGVKKLGKRLEGIADER